MQLFHLGLHKTGTTSLQKNLFLKGSTPYCGLHAHNWHETRDKWLDFFMGEGKAPTSKGDNFIYSYEATLLRCGGLECAADVAHQIARNFSSPIVLITIREPSALLVSAYFQSLRLRRSALGFINGNPIFRQSVRFMPFEDWWRLLDHNQAISLAGLLDYGKLRAAFESRLAPEQIVFLKLEWLSDKKPAYRDRLQRIGFPSELLDDFLSTPPENIGASKKLQRERPMLSRLGRLLTKLKLSDPMDSAIRAAGLMHPAEKILYGGKANAKLQINDRLLEEIKEKYRSSYDSLT